MAASNIRAAYLPGDLGHGRGFEFAELLRSPDPQDYQRKYIYDVTPVTDNRPFFFYFVQPRDIWRYLTRPSASVVYLPVLFGLMGVSIMATFIILILPPLALGIRLPRRKGSVMCLSYFVCIGAGYILVEVALVQRFILFLGQPTHALTVVIFSMLVSSGLGSRLSLRLLKGSLTLLVKALGMIAVLVALLGILAWSVLAVAVALPLWLKITITILMISPAAFVMGMAFPTGLTSVEAWHKPSVRWAWSLNAASSVLGTVGALMCAIYLGLLQTLVMGSLLYLAALAVMWRLASQEPAEQTSATQEVIEATSRVL